VFQEVGHGPLKADRQYTRHHSISLCYRTCVRVCCACCLLGCWSWPFEAQSHKHLPTQCWTVLQSGTPCAHALDCLRVCVWGGGVQAVHNLSTLTDNAAAARVAVGVLLYGTGHARYTLCRSQHLLPQCWTVLQSGTAWVVLPSSIICH
jgi:hypothetical protein